MEDIASKYDIALFRLYARNRMPKGSQPIVGEVIHLKNKIRLKDRPKFVRFPSKSDRTSEFLFETDVDFGFGTLCTRHRLDFQNGFRVRTLKLAN